MSEKPSCLSEELVLRPVLFHPRLSITPGTTEETHHEEGDIQTSLDSGRHYMALSARISVRKNKSRRKNEPMRKHVNILYTIKCLGYSMTL